LARGAAFSSGEGKEAVAIFFRESLLSRRWGCAYRRRGHPGGLLPLDAEPLWVFGTPAPNGPAGARAGPAFGAGPRSGWPGWSYEGAHEGITLGERHRGKTRALQAEPRSGTGWGREPTGGSRAGPFCQVGDLFDGRRVLGEAGHDVDRSPEAPKAFWPKAEKGPRLQVFRASFG
jgi:hypothetical protein